MKRIGMLAVPSLLFSLLLAGKANAQVQTCSSSVCLWWRNTSTGSETGIQGESTGTAGVGVQGISNNGPSAVGVVGSSSGGFGVEGSSTTGYGVVGRSLSSSSTGTGVYGSVDVASTGNGVYGDSAGSWTAWAGNYNGDVQARGFYSTSDARLKKNIKDAPYGLNELMKLRPVTYNWKAGSDHPVQNGLIAQEVQKIFPSSIRIESKTGMLSIDYVSLLPVAIKAIQQQQAVIAKQEARLSELERKNGPIASSILPQTFGGWAAISLLPVGVLISRRRRSQRAGGEPG